MGLGLCVRDCVWLGLCVVVWDGVEEPVAVPDTLGVPDWELVPEPLGVPVPVTEGEPDTLGEAVWLLVCDDDGDCVWLGDDESVRDELWVTLGDALGLGVPLVLVV